MIQTQKTVIPKRKKMTGDEESDDSALSTAEEKRKKLKELDGFIENVLREAGEEFLDEFKQVEGE